MKSERFAALLSEIDDDLLEGAELAADQAKAPRKNAWIRWVAVAACVVLVSVMIPTTVKLVNERPRYTAEEIAALFPLRDVLSTNVYDEVYAFGVDTLYAAGGAIPDEGALPLYTRSSGLPLDRTEFAGFLDSVLPGLCERLNTAVPAYTIKDAYSGTSTYINAETDVGYDLSASQSMTKNALRFTIAGDVDPHPFTDGEGNAIQLDQRQSDEAILASVSSMKEELFAALGVAFPDAKVVRSFYEANGYYPLKSIEIYFYDHAAHPLNAYASNEPVSDHLVISFSGGEAALTRITIGYTKNRAAVDTLYTVTDHAPLISLAEAEALLAKDYVFSTHVCSFCMSQQDKVDFSTYDHVGLVYLFGETEEDADSIGVPFYVFFKKLSGPGRYSGTYRYAKTYVPAIRVSGLEAYFAEQMQTHHPEDIVD